MEIHKKIVGAILMIMTENLIYEIVLKSRDEIDEEIVSTVSSLPISSIPHKHIILRMEYLKIKSVYVRSFCKENLVQYLIYLSIVLLGAGCLWEHDVCRPTFPIHELAAAPTRALVNTTFSVNVSSMVWTRKEQSVTLSSSNNGPFDTLRCCVPNHIRVQGLYHHYDIHHTPLDSLLHNVHRCFLYLYSSTSF